jgi:hypothetical protein
MVLAFSGLDFQRKRNLARLLRRQRDVQTVFVAGELQPPKFSKLMDAANGARPIW